MAALAERPERIDYLPVAALVPREDQPRQFFDAKALEELAADLAQNGVRCPLAVRPAGEGRWEVLAGHRRLKAAKLAHLEEVPCVVYELEDAAAEAFVVFDNLNRSDLLPWEEGQGFCDLISKHGMSAAAVGQKIGKSEGYIQGRIALAAGLGERAQTAYLAQELTLGTLQLLATIPNRPLQTRDCPACQRISNHEQGDLCPGCFADLSEIALVSGGNPQGAAVSLCRGKTPEVAKAVIERVKESYGLDNRAGQLTMDLGTLLAAPEVVACKHKLDAWLESIGRMGNWLLEHKPEVERLSGEQRAAIGQQAEAAVAVIREVQRVAGQGGLF